MKRMNNLRRLNAWLTERWRWLRSLSRDDVSKQMFEHVRNLGLCALVLGAGHYELRNPAYEEGPFHWITVSFLFMFGSLLYFLNMLNAYEKLINAGYKKDTLLSLGNFYSLFTFVIINSVLGS